VEEAPGRGRRALRLLPPVQGSRRRKVAHMPPQRQHRYWNGWRYAVQRMPAKASPSRRQCDTNAPAVARVAPYRVLSSGRSSRGVEPAASWAPRHKTPLRGHARLRCSRWLKAVARRVCAASRRIQKAYRWRFCQAVKRQVEEAREAAGRLQHAQGDTANSPRRSMNRGQAGLHSRPVLRQTAPSRCSRCGVLEGGRYRQAW